MKHSIGVGFCFGLTSAVITTLGLIVGLHASTQSRIAVIGGILVIAVADALSDALGIHISEEYENTHSSKEIWVSTLCTFVSKLVFALTFIVPVLLFQLTVAIIVCVLWGLCLLSFFSFILARKKGAKAYKVVIEHLTIAILVIIITHWIGDMVLTFSKL